MRRHTNPRTGTPHEAARSGVARTTGGDAAVARGRHRADTTARDGRPPSHGAHGSSPAAWIGVVVILAGLCVAGAAMIADLPWLFWTGLGIAVLGVVAGKLLSVTGFGLTPGYHQEGDVGLRDRLFGTGGRETEPRIPGDPHEWRGVGDGDEVVGEHGVGRTEGAGRGIGDDRDDGREH